MNNTSIIEQIVFEKLAKEISKEIDYSGIAKKVAPAFKKKIVQASIDYVESDIDFYNWLDEVMKNDIFDTAMEAVAQTLANSMVASLKASK